MANPHYPQLDDREWLIQNYVTERKSFKQIGAELGCYGTTVAAAAVRHGIPKRSATAQRDLTAEDIAAWAAKGGVEMNHPIGPTEHKAAAEELGYSSVDDLIVLTRQNDPFYAGTDGQITDAKWFKAHWWEHRQTGHIRRLHYRLDASKDATFPNGEPYVNNLACFTRLCTMGASARALNEVDASQFTDRRNPEPVINIEPRLWEPEPGIEIEEPNWHLPSLPEYSLYVGGSGIPKPTVTGYGYDPADQPYLLEVWPEKSTVNDVLDPLCEELDVNLVTASGNQSITRAVGLLRRCREFGKPGIAFYVSDCDKAGGHMPTAVARQLEFHRQRDFPDVDVVLVPIALTQQQVDDLELPVSFDEDENVQVELDALEALHPGELERLVREAVAEYRDPDIADELGTTMSSALRAVGSAWAQDTSELRSELGKLAADAEKVAEPFRVRLDELRAEFDQEIAPVREREAELREELTDLWDDFDPDLPDRPEAEPPEIDEDVLFDSRRHWLDQLARYREGR